MRTTIFIIPLAILLNSCEFQTVPNTKFETKHYDTSAVISSIKNQLNDYEGFELVSTRTKSHKGAIDYSIRFKTKYHDTNELLCKAMVQYQGKTGDYTVHELKICDEEKLNDHKTHFCNKSTKHKNPVESNICKIAKDKYPDNPKMQAFTYKKQMSAYQYMQSINNTKMKLISQNAHPNDFWLQKHYYTSLN